MKLHPNDLAAILTINTTSIVVVLFYLFKRELLEKYVLLCSLTCISMSIALAIAILVSRIKVYSDKKKINKVLKDCGVSRPKIKSKWKIQI